MCVWFQAYKCLSDDERRTAFNLERWKNFCIGCNRIPYATSCNSPTNFRAPKLKPTRSRSCRIPLEGLKDMRTRFKEEARVIQNCLKANNTLSRKESPLFDPSQTALQSENRYELNKESPVFDPSDYVFEGYPHIRSQMCKKPECFWYLRRENVVRHGEGKVGMDDIPVFRTRSDWIMFKSKSTRARSWFIILIRSICCLFFLRFSFPELCFRFSWEILRLTNLRRLRTVRRYTLEITHQSLVSAGKRLYSHLTISIKF